MAYDKVIDSSLLDANLTSIANAIREKAELTESFAFPQGFIDAIASLGDGIGNIFGTSKYEVGSVIANGGQSILIPKPEWVSNLDKLNFIIFTLNTYDWDASYWTVLIKIIRDTVTIGCATTNDSAVFSSGIGRAIDNGNIIQLLSFFSGSYTAYGCEYFYIIWENE